MTFSGVVLGVLYEAPGTRRATTHTREIIAMADKNAPNRITENDPLTLDEEYREVEFNALPEWAQELRLKHEEDQFWAGGSYVERNAARLAAEDTTTL